METYLIITLFKVGGALVQLPVMPQQSMQHCLETRARLRVQFEQEKKTTQFSYNMICIITPDKPIIFVCNKNIGCKPMNTVDNP